MEFKQPTRYNRVPPRPHPSPQRGVNPATPRPVQPISQPVLPSKKADASHIRHRLFTKKTIVAVSIVAVVICVLVIVALVRHHAQPTSTDMIKDPGYHTILPKGASITQLGGWERISPPESTPVFAYADTIGSVSISVSEQPLPPTFNSDTSGQVAELAKSYNATDKIDANGTIVYVGTSAKGPQSVIFTKDDLLILIKSHAKIDDKAWIAYINSLD